MLVRLLTIFKTANGICVRLVISWNCRNFEISFDGISMIKSTLMHIFHLAKYQSTHALSLRAKSLSSDVLQPPFELQAIPVALVVCDENTFAQLKPGEMANLDMIPFL